MDVSYLILILAFVLPGLILAVMLHYRLAGSTSVNRLIFGAAFAVPLFIYLLGEEDRFVHYLEARGYSDVQIEHPTQFNCLQRWITSFSYRARSPNGSPVHGGACVLFFATETTEPIEKYSARR